MALEAQHFEMIMQRFDLQDRAHQETRAEVAALRADVFPLTTRVALLERAEKQSDSTIKTWWSAVVALIAAGIGGVIAKMFGGSQ